MPEKFEYKQAKPASEFADKESLLRKTPRELADYFSQLYKANKLEVFLEKASDDPALRAQFGYWEKWFGTTQRELVDSIVAKKQEIYGEKSSDLPLALNERFSGEELEIVISNIRAIQLTYGCSKRCAFCAIDAVPGVKDHIPYSQLANLFKKHGKLMKDSEPFLYWASDPSDYTSKEGLEDRTYEDVHQLALEYAGYDPHITSKETDDPRWIEFMKAAGTGKGGRRISAYGATKEKYKELGEKMRGGRDYVDVLGLETEHIKGIGVSQNKFGTVSPDELVKGIGCKEGLVLTPRGLYSVVQVPVSKEFPQGQIFVPFEEFDDDDVKIGDSLADIVRHKVPIMPEYSMYSESKAKKTSEGISQVFNEGVFPKEVFVHGKTRGFVVQIDQNGRILGVSEKSLVDRKKDVFENSHKKAVDDFLSGLKRHMRQASEEYDYDGSSVIDFSDLYGTEDADPNRLKILILPKTKMEISERDIILWVVGHGRPWDLYMGAIKDGKINLLNMARGQGPTEPKLEEKIKRQGKMIHGPADILDQIKVPPEKAIAANVVI